MRHHKQAIKRRATQRLARRVWFRARGLTFDAQTYTMQHPDEMLPDQARAIYDYACGTPNRWVVECLVHQSDHFGIAWYDIAVAETVQSCRIDYMHDLTRQLFDDLLSEANHNYVDAIESRFRVA